jgi:hypothetical protein
MDIEEHFMILNAKAYGLFYCAELGGKISVSVLQIHIGMLLLSLRTQLMS